MRYFVTGSGTEVGKTYSTASWVRTLRARGRSVTALKPIVSGLDALSLAASDPGVLLQAMGRPVTPETVAEVSPWRFGPPISPDMAAARAGTPLQLDSLVSFCRQADDEVVLVEGVGGVMVPLNDTTLVRDWMVALGWPVVLVTGSYLGALSHTLSAVAAVEVAGLDVHAVIVSQSPVEPVPLAETVATLQRFCGVQVVPLPRGGQVSLAV